MIESLTEYVRSRIDPKVYYSSHFPELRWPEGGTEPRVLCVFHKDSAPSLHFNPESGAWFCHGCNSGGKSILSFHAKLHRISAEEAAQEIYHKFVRPTIDPDKVDDWGKALKKTPSVIEYLKKTRLLTDKIITKYQLGYGMGGGRIIFPIKNEFGLFINAKAYDPLWKKRKVKQKMINYRDENESREFGSPVELYPLNVMRWCRTKGYVVICEGEWDTLFLLSLGIPAVTSTGGSRSWPKARTELFRGLQVYIAYDNDKDGMKFDRRVVLRNIRNVAKAVYRVKIPKEVKGKKVKDVLEWGLADPAMRIAKGWLRAFKAAKKLLENPDDFIDRGEAKRISLDQATKSDCFNKRLMIDAIVTGKDTAPYMLPKKARVSCTRSCDECPLAEKEDEFREVVIDPNDPKILNMVDKSQKEVHNYIIKLSGVKNNPSCGGRCEITETFNVEQLLLIPTLDSNSQYVLRRSYFVGHGLQSNRAYEFIGTTVPDPQDQHATHLFDKARPVQDEIETFRMTPELKERLDLFQCPRRKPLLKHLESIAEWQSRNVTKIKQRHDLHIAVDLVYHSLGAFDFHGEFQKRGMLDVLILGDTRCGKGFVAEGLKRYYGLGEVASGESCTYAGLIGGVQQTSKRFFITWGLIPLNHGRLVIIDEASALSVDDFGKMSRVRSEGVAEIIKIVRESTRANTRLLWLSNARLGKKMEEYDEGVQAIKPLIGANEDISRFDFCLIVARGEVPSSIINTTENENGKNDKDLYPAALCRSLVLWAWSRRPDQIKFTDKAIKAVIQEAIKFGHTFTADIPLVQAENIRIKIAKIAAAIAARTFSTDKTGEHVVIYARHVHAACDFLRQIYSKPSMAYDLYSRRMMGNSKLNVQGAISLDLIFQELNERKHSTIRGLLSMHRVTSDGLADYMGDPVVARELLSELVKANAVSRIEGTQFYIKNPLFSQWLRNKASKSFNIKENHDAAVDPSEGTGKQ